jgi:hypothetical protein
VVPADHKHVAWLVVAEAIISALEGLRLDFPKVEGKALKELQAVERALKAEKSSGRSQLQGQAPAS